MTVRGGRPDIQPPTVSYRVKAFRVIHSHSDEALGEVRVELIIEIDGIKEENTMALDFEVPMILPFISELSFNADCAFMSQEECDAQEED